LGMAVVAIVSAVGFHVWGRWRQDRTGAQMPTALVAAALIVGLPALVIAAAGVPFGFDIAKLSGFNLKGGLQVIPEMAALIFGLVTLTAAFIAEIVRAGLLAVPVGQGEAAAALGLSRGLTMIYAGIPQGRGLITRPL